MSYLASGMDRMLFQWSFPVVKSSVGMETGTLYVSFSPPNMMRTLCFFPIGFDVSDNVKVIDLDVLDKCMAVDEEIHSHPLYISDSLEESAYIFDHGPGPF